MQCMAALSAHSTRPCQLCLAPGAGRAFLAFISSCMHHLVRVRGHASSQRCSFGTRVDAPKRQQEPQRSKSTQARHLTANISLKWTFPTDFLNAGSPAMHHPARRMIAMFLPFRGTFLPCRLHSPRHIVALTYPASHSFQIRRKGIFDGQLRVHGQILQGQSRS